MPDYLALSQYLFAPLVSNSAALSLHCETTAGGKHVMIRVAFDAADRGRVLGKNGRTVHMIRTLLDIAAKNADQGVDINIYSQETEEAAPKPRRPPRPKTL